MLFDRPKQSPELFYKRCFYKFCKKFTGKHLCHGLIYFFWFRCFPVHVAKFLRTYFLQNTSGRLLFDRDTLWQMVFWMTYLLFSVTKEQFEEQKLDLIDIGKSPECLHWLIWDDFISASSSATASFSFAEVQTNSPYYNWIYFIIDSDLNFELPCVCTSAEVTLYSAWENFFW